MKVGSLLPSVGPRVELRLSGLAACVFTRRAISPAQVLLLNTMCMYASVPVYALSKDLPLLEWLKLLNLHFITVTLKRVYYKAFGVFFFLVSMECS